MANTVFHELAGNESLFISTAYCREKNESERVCIGWVDDDIKQPDGTISLQIVQFGKVRGCEVLQACLNESEIDLVVDGLLQAKKHMQEVRT